MTSPPVGDDGILRGVEAGPQRHSDDPFEKVAGDIAWRFGAGRTHSLAHVIAAALRSVDRAAREECARIADDFNLSKTARQIAQAIRDDLESG